MYVIWVVAPPSVLLLDIVTSLPPDTGVTDRILLVTVLDEPVRATTDLYTQVLPTAIGNGTELDDTVDVDPPPEVLELEVVLDDGLLELLPLEPLLLELPLFELPPPDVPHAVRMRPAATMSAAAAPARPRAELMVRFMSLTSIVD